MNDNEPLIFAIVGRVREANGNEPVPIAVFVSASDDDDAVRKSLNALAEEGYLRAELDRIGVVDSVPDDAAMRRAYDDAVAGQVAVIAYRREFDGDGSANVRN